MNLLYDDDVPLFPSHAKITQEKRQLHLVLILLTIMSLSIDKETAQTTSHYLFQYDLSGRIIEIINNHYHTERQHPLASLGVYKVEIKYNKNQEIRVFYDKNKKRISNDREVFKEVFSFDKDGFKNKLQFYDTENNPMESNWGISEYYWSKHKKLIIETRYNLEKAAVALSPYFQFETTGILLDKKGFPLAHYNLDTNLKVIANDKLTGYLEGNQLFSIKVK